MQPFSMPTTMIKAFRIEACDMAGKWQVVYKKDNNYKRLVKVSLNIEATAIRLVPEATWGSDKIHIFAFDVYETATIKKIGDTQAITDKVSKTITAAQSANASRSNTVTH